MKNRLVFREGVLEFDFTGCVHAEPFEEQFTAAQPHGMCPIDFLVEEEDRILFIEVTDYRKGIQKKKKNDQNQFKSPFDPKMLVHQELVPKARDSYTYLHLMKRDRKEIFYVVVIGTKDSVEGHVLNLSTVAYYLRGRLEKEASEEWKKKYVTGSFVISPNQWNDYFPQFSLKEIII